MQITVNSIVIAICVLCMVFGLLFGLLRGFNRSLFRLILVGLCLVGAWFLRGVIVNAIIGIKIKGQTIDSLIFSAIGGGNLPSSVTDLIYVVIKIILNAVCFLLFFFLLRFLSWAIIFPICKIFIRKGRKKRAVLGGVVGIVQGALIAIIICVPISGLITNTNMIVAALQGESISTTTESAFVDKVLTVYGAELYTEDSDSNDNTDKTDSTDKKDNTDNTDNTDKTEKTDNTTTTTTTATGLEINGKPIITDAVKTGLAKFGVSTYADSTMGKLYTKFGSGLYEELTVTKDKDGNKITLTTIATAVSASVKIYIQADKLSKVNFSSGITKDNETTVIESLRAIDGIIDKDLKDESACKIVNSILTGFMDGKHSSVTLPEDFDVSNLDCNAAADSIEVIYDCFLAEDSKEFTDEEAKKLVEGISKNEMLITAVAGNTNLIGKMDETEKETMSFAIAEIITDEEAKKTLQKLLGVEGYEGKKEDSGNTDTEGKTDSGSSGTENTDKKEDTGSTGGNGDKKTDSDNETDIIDVKKKEEESDN